MNNIDSEANEKFTKIKEAYKVLNDPVERDKYDNKNILEYYDRLGVSPLSTCDEIREAYLNLKKKI